MFKEGDKVICVDNNTCGLTIGKSYRVFKVDVNTYYGDPNYIFVEVIDDSGEDGQYYSYRFVLDIKYERKKKIRRCLREVI